MWIFPKQINIGLQYKLLKETLDPKNQKYYQREVSEILFIKYSDF